MRSLVKKGLMTPEGSAIKNNNKETTMNNNFLAIVMHNHFAQTAP